MADLGRASKVTVGRDTTVILTDGVDTNEVSRRIEELWVQHDNSTRKGERDFIKERIASLSGGVGVVHVGGESDIEQKELYDRVDDAVCAVRSAMEEGIVAGGGVALFNVASQLIAVADENFDQMSREEYLAHHIVAKSMMEPLLQIMRNGGLDGFEVMAEVSQTNHGYDLKNGRYGDMFEMGVIDPLKVTRNALRNAMSVAGTILTTNAIVTIARA
jgi:chaperonin GroEL